MEKNELVTIEELCKILHIGKSTAMKLINEGKIKAVKPGRRWIIPVDAIEVYIQKETGIK